MGAISDIKVRLGGYLEKDNPRSRKLVSNIISTLAVKILNIATGLILIPLTISFVSPVQFGIWLTISSIVGWMSFFDIGLGNGLRNKIAESVALEKYQEAKTYISTTYACLCIISILLIFVVLIVNPYINWQSVLNIPGSVQVDIQTVVLIVLCSFCFQFVVQLVNTVLTALHEPSKASWIALSGQVAVLVIILLLKKIEAGNLKHLVVVLTAVPIVTMFIASIYLYKNKLRSLSPSFKDIDFKHIKPLLNVGGLFFIIQIGAMVLFQTDNIIITRVLGLKAVTEFNIAYKLFAVVTMLFTIIVTPYWSAFTDAYAQKDISWMKRNLKLMRKMVLYLSVLVIIIGITSPWLYKLWLGDTVTIQANLTYAMMAYVIVYMWQTAHVFILNGISKIRLQFYLVIGSALLNIPLAVLLGKKYGLAGIISANTIEFILMGIIFSVQVEKILNHKSVGIWDK